MQNYCVAAMKISVTVSQEAGNRFTSRSSSTTPAHICKGLFILLGDTFSSRHNRCTHELTWTVAACAGAELVQARKCPRIERGDVDMSFHPQTRSYLQLITARKD